MHYDRWWNPAVEDQATDRACWTGRALADATILIEKIMADAPAVLAQGDLPDELAPALSRRVDLAVPPDEHVAHCTCSDRRTPCLHILATLYTLIRRLDEHPRTALDLRLPSSAPALDHNSSPDWTALAELDPALFDIGHVNTDE